MLFRSVQDVVLLGGCDSTVEGLARVQEGWQVADILPNYEEMSQAMAKICATWLATGACPSEMANGITDNEYGDGMPTLFVNPVLVTQENIQQEVFDACVATVEAVEQVAKTLR